MDHIDIISDREVNQDLIDDLRHRSLDQKYSYMSNGASQYYSMRQNRIQKGGNLDPTHYAPFFKKIIAPHLKGRPFVFISLASGNGCQEHELLDSLSRQSSQFSYVAIDSSAEMIKLAEAAYSGVSFPCHFIRGDFSKYYFIAEMNEVIDMNAPRVYVFLGTTFGSFVLTEIMDILVNLLRKGDILWFDTDLRPDETEMSTMKLFKEVSAKIDHDPAKHRYFLPLQQLNVPSAAGTMGLRLVKSIPAKGIELIYFFQSKQKISINFRSTHTIIMPGEEIELFRTRYYLKEALIDYFGEYGLACLGSFQDGKVGQFVFQL